MKKKIGENDAKQYEILILPKLRVLALFHFVNTEQLKMLLTASENGAQKIFGLPPVVNNI